MIRTYHGCQIESTPAKTVMDGKTVLCDGYSHTVTKDGETVGVFDTLASAIANAKATREPYTYQPIVEE